VINSGMAKRKIQSEAKLSWTGLSSLHVSCDVIHVVIAQLLREIPGDSIQHHWDETL
jgi:hypothetical protein